MRVARSEKGAEEMMKNFMSSIRACKKLLDNENKMFSKTGIASLNKGQPKVLEAMQEFHTCYKDVENTRELKSVVPEGLLKAAYDEYSEFQKIMKEYYVHLRAASNVGEMFLNSMRKNMSRDVKKDRGYNKDGLFVSDKMVLSSMPPITINDRV